MFTSELMQPIAEIFADVLPKICESISKLDNDDDKRAAIGAVTQTILAGLVDFCIYGDFILDNSPESVEWQREVIERLANMLSAEE